MLSVTPPAACSVPVLVTVLPVAPLPTLKSPAAETRARFINAPPALSVMSAADVVESVAPALIVIAPVVASVTWPRCAILPLNAISAAVRFRPPLLVKALVAAKVAKPLTLAVVTPVTDMAPASVSAVVCNVAAPDTDMTALVFVAPTVIAEVDTEPNTKSPETDRSVSIEIASPTKPKSPLTAKVLL